MKGGWPNPISLSGLLNMPLFCLNAILIVSKIGSRLMNRKLSLVWGIIRAPTPGYKLHLKEVLLALHNSLLAHGRAVQAFKTVR